MRAMPKAIDQGIPVDGRALERGLQQHAQALPGVVQRKAGFDQERRLPQLVAQINLYRPREEGRGYSTTLRHCPAWYSENPAS